jgi:hypothetical protein
MSITFINNTPALRALVLSATTTALTNACRCASLGACAGWESITEDRWPAQMQQLATLRDPDLYEPTFEEFHQGTRYDSPDAPIALKHFPYNRCDVWQCTCGRLFLRYTEFGGYYVDHRVRALNPALIVDAT